MSGRLRLIQTVLGGLDVIDGLGLFEGTRRCKRCIGRLLVFIEVYRTVARVTNGFINVLNEVDFSDLAWTGGP